MKMVLWEIWSYLQIVVVWYAFRRFAKRNVTGEIMAGTIIGVCLEFISEPFWIYHFRINIYKDIPLSIPLAWGVMFTLVVFLSEKLYCWILKKETVAPYDRRILIFDVIGAIAIGLPFETIGVKTGIWDYRNDLLQWDWGLIPFFNMPIEALAAYALLMVVAPTFVRYWESSFDDTLKRRRS